MGSNPTGSTMKVSIEYEDVAEIIDWWRAANEAPGGISALKAIMGMGGAVQRLYEQVKVPYNHRPPLTTDTPE